MNELVKRFKNPHIIIGGKKIEYKVCIEKIRNTTIELIAFEMPFKLTQENLDFVKSIQEKIKVYQDTRYNDYLLSNIKDPVKLKVLGGNKMDIHNAIILELKHEIADFNKLHIFHMKDDAGDYLIDRDRYQEICLTDMNRIIAYGVCAEID